jgi:hypothetical protein
LIKNQKIFGYYFLYLIPTALNESKITFFLLPVMLLLSLHFSKKLNPKYILIVCVFLLVFATGYTTMFNAIGYKQSFAEIFSYEGLKAYLLEDGAGWGEDAGRLTKYLMAFDLIKDSPYFGYGLGASYGGNTSGLAGYVFAHNSGGVKLGGTRPQFVLSLIDLGLIGTVIVLFLLVIVLYKLLSLRALSLEKLVALNSLIIIFVGFPYQQIFYSYQLMFIFMVFTFICLRLSSHSQQFKIAAF